jgi:hypothetical protein
MLAATIFSLVAGTDFPDNSLLITLWLAAATRKDA